MHKDMLSSFGFSTQRVISALHALQQENGILVIDDEDRENEGDIIFSTA